MAERCWADQLDVNVDCELEAGHEGDHVCTFTWPQTEPAPTLAASASLTGGFAAYLKNRYGEARHG